MVVMNYQPVFYQHPAIIAFGSTVIICILLILIISIIQPRISSLAFLNKRRINGICFLIGLIIGLCVSSTNQFTVFNELDDNVLWYWKATYLIAGLSNLCISILLIGFLLLLPCKLFVNLYKFKTSNRRYQLWGKVSLMYLVFGTLAILVSLLMYPLSNTFLSASTTSEFSSASLPLILDDKLDGEVHLRPTIYVIGSYLLVNLLKVKTINFSFGFSLYLLVVFIISFIIITIAIKKANGKIHQVVQQLDKWNTKISSWLGIVSTIFTFIAIIACLMIQPVGTGLRFSLIMILITILAISIWLVDLLIVFYQKNMSLKQFFQYTLSATKLSFQAPVHHHWMTNLTKHEHLKDHADNLKDKQLIYNIFVTSIFSLVIVSYLGFSAGPLHIGYTYGYVDGKYVTINFGLSQHIIFWICLYLFGYLLTLLYTFKHNDGGAFKMLLSGATPYIHSGYNTGILNYFNWFIDRISIFTSYTTYIAYNVKHHR